MYWPEKLYLNLWLTVRFSFLTLYLTIKYRQTRCTACLYGMMSRINLLCARRCLPKASAKVKQIFKPTNFWRRKIKKISLNFIIKYFIVSFHININHFYQNRVSFHTNTALSPPQKVPHSQKAQLLFCTTRSLLYLYTWIPIYIW